MDTPETPVAEPAARNSRPKKQPTTDQKLHHAVQLIDGLLVPETAPLLFSYGYSLADLQGGRLRYDQLIAMQQQCLILRSEARAAKLAFDQLWQAAQEAYGHHLRLARVKL